MNPVGLYGGRLRIVVWVREPAPAAERLLEEAARLATRLRSELVAAFVGDPALIWSASLPFTRLVTRLGIADGEFRPESARRAMRMLAAELEQLVARVARRCEIACRFFELELAPGARPLQPGDVLIADARELRTLLATLGSLSLPAGTVLAVRGPREGPLVVLSTGDPATMTLLGRLVEEAGFDAILHLVAPPGGEGAAVASTFGRLEQAGVRIRRASDLESALKAAVGDIIEEGGGVLIDGALVALVLARLLEAMAGGAGTTDSDRAGTAPGPSGNGEEPTA